MEDKQEDIEYTNELDDALNPLVNAGPGYGTRRCMKCLCWSCVHTCGKCYRTGWRVECNNGLKRTTYCRRYEDGRS